MNDHPTEQEPTVRILGIAPYEGMRTAILRCCEAFPDVEMTARTGDLEEGCAILRQLGEDNFDAVISRGGTAEMLRRETNLPVIDIRITVFDILRSITLAETYSDRFAVVGFSRVTQAAHTLSELLRHPMEIITVHAAEEVRAALKKIREKNIDTVICDMVTHTLAMEQDFNAFLVSSGEESLHDALLQAAEQGKTFRKLRMENSFLRRLLSREHIRAAVMDRRGNLLFSSPENPDDSAFSHFRELLPSVPKSGIASSYYFEGHTMHHIRSSSFSSAGKDYTAFVSEDAHIPLRGVRAGIRSDGRVECEYLLSGTIFSINGALGDVKARARLAAGNLQPVMITGEPGTGAEYVARGVYLESQMTHRPLITMDCAVIDDRGWDFLLEHHASPLVTGGAVLYFQHMDQLPPDKAKQLLSGILSTGLERRLRLIFSASYRENQETPAPVRDFCQHIGFFRIQIPTLRSRAEEIPALTSLYLMQQNIRRGRQISGFDPEARRMMTAYEWPHNYVQLQNVLDELSALAGGGYISARVCAEVLGKERKLYRTSSLYTRGTGYKEKRTLDEITGEAVLAALEACGGSQTEAARQLGISRTTLWRFLKKEGRSGTAEKLSDGPSKAGRP